MKKYYPHSELFLEKVREANAFLMELSCTEFKEEDEWEISLTYKNDDISVRHYFGDRDMLYNTVVGIAKYNFNEYALWEWISALGVVLSDKITDNTITDVESLKSLIENSALCLKMNIDLLLSSDQTIINAMDKARDKVREEWDKQWE